MAAHTVLQLERQGDWSLSPGITAALRGSTEAKKGYGAGFV